MLTRFQLDAYLTTQAMLQSWGPSYQTELDHVTSIIASEIDLAVDAALNEDLWRCDSDGNVLPVAASYRRRAAQRSVADAWSTGSTFALMDALNAIQSPSKVSLVKSAPATYCTGSALPTRAHPASYFTTSLRRNNLHIFAIACTL